MEIFLPVFAIVFGVGLVFVIIATALNNTSISAGKVGRAGDVKCPRCKEFIKADAEVCKHCGWEKSLPAASA